MKRIEKEQVVQALEEKFEKSSSVLFTEYRGLNVQKMQDLRKLTREAKVDFLVVKNTLARMAYKKLNIEQKDRFFTGPTALAFSWDDPIIPIKVLKAFAKENPELVIKGGVVEGKVMAEEKLNDLASLPSKEVLLCQMLMGLQAPLRNLVNVLNGPLQGLMNCLKAIEQKKAEQ